MSFVVSLAGLIFIGGSMHGQAQDGVEDAIRQVSAENVRGYVQPFVNGLGASLNSGWYQSAAIGDMGFHIRLQVIASGTLIGDADKTYGALPPEPFERTPVETATLFGDRGTVVDGPGGTTYQFQNGQVRTRIFPSATLQLSIGNLFGTQAVLRYVPVPEIDNFPRTTFFGFGARHSISQYLPSSPVDLAAGFFTQQLIIGDIMKVNAFAFGGQVSKSLSVVTFYGGLQYESSTLTLSYTSSSTNSRVNTDIDSENHVRATAGIGLDFTILNLNTDVSLGKVVVVSSGISFGL
ncbi:MAG TPA: DUF6588 family protein [Bacteroidota bacterium]|jgi:hypothetical protein|nr:DUF6588 family protein [Bacteroidota bacterium]